MVAEGADVGRRLVGGGLVAALVLALVALAAPAQAATARTTNAAWLPYWNMPDAVASVTGTDRLKVASPFWYSASCSKVTGRPGAGSRSVIRQLRAAHTKVVPTVTGGAFGPKRAIGCFGDDAKRHAHVRALVRLAESRTAYSGLDIDYESFPFTGSLRQATKIRAAFNDFVADLCRALHRHDLTCSITVMARTSSEPGDTSPITWVYDYAFIAQHADVVRIMAYDQHIGSTGPGPIAGIGWVKSVVRFALTEIPARKLMLGIPLYGRDWVGTHASSLTMKAAVALAQRRDRTIHWDPDRKESWFTYRKKGKKHTVWFSSKPAVAVRYRLVVRKGLRGAAFWAAGYERRGTWEKLGG